MYIFKAKLEDTELNIIRRFQVPDDFGVYELGCTVVALFGFQGYHCINVNIGDDEYRLDEEDDWDDEADEDEEFEEHESNPSIKTAFKRTKDALVEYDFGDGWEISVKLEKHTNEYGPVKLLSGTGRGCIEDVGGTGGLENFVRAFTEKNEDYYELREWQGIEEYDWENCYVDKINEKLDAAVSVMYKACVNNEDPFEIEEAFDGEDLDEYIEFGYVKLEDYKKWFEESFGVRFWSDEE